MANELPHNAGKLTSLADIREYILGGHARFTLVSNKSNERKTFRVRVGDKAGEQPEGVEGPWFVDLLTGPDNTFDYQYLGFLFTAREGLRFRQNKEGWGNESAGTFGWLVRRVNEIARASNDDLDVLDHRFNQQAEFYHLGTCARCGRDLTTPESIARGLGPVCADA